MLLNNEEKEWKWMDTTAQNREFIHENAYICMPVLVSSNISKFKYKMFKRLLNLVNRPEMLRIFM